MRASKMALALTALGLAACAAANATPFDGDDDVHCSTIAFYQQGLAEHVGAPADQRRATKAVHEWYAAKVRAIAAKDGLDSLQRRVEPVLEAVKRDPQSSREAMLRCADRAIAEGLR